MSGGTVLRAEKRYLLFEEEKTRVIFSLSEKIRDSAKRFLKKRKFLEITPPVLAPVTDPGLRGAKRLETDYYGKKYHLTSSMILHKIAASSFLERDVFSFSPCIRGEEIRSKRTGRHLSEFWQIDVELFHKGRDDAMKVCEELFHAVIRNVQELASAELAFLGRGLEVPRLPFPRLGYAELFDKAQSLDYSIVFGEEIPWPVEKEISDTYETPFFIVDFPTGSRGFYDKIAEEAPDRLLSFDLIYPEGFGEAVSGSEREYHPDIVTTKLKAVGEEPKDYDWYIEMLRQKSCKTAGFGYGFERLVRFISGVYEIKCVTPFPRVAGEHDI
ncbi:MAG: asparagine synthetase A [Candidatus Hodarchaeales archaeon]